MVAVDDAGNPVGVPPLVPTTELERTRYAAAVTRRAALKSAFAD
jgi:acyl-CoA hydrolase